MTNKIVERIVYFFQVAGYIAASLYWIVLFIEELTLLPWAEWAENGVLDYIKSVGRTIILLPFWLFIIWILHAMAMFGFHKLWPDEYDERGHRRK